MLARAITRLAPWLLCALGLVASPQPLEADALQLGPSTGALRGLPHAGAPVTADKELTLRATAGYGATGSRALAPATTHTLFGGLAVGVNPLRWLGFGLRLDGRLELHGDDGYGSHTAGYGDPRLFVRAGHQLDNTWSVGGELLVWTPGTEAPSFVASATSLDARILGAYHPPDARFAVLASVGARLDNSASIAPDRSRLRASDIQSLGVSDSNAVLAAFGALVEVAPRWQAFAELSADLLVGDRAPPRLTDSPLRVTAGARWALTPQWQADASAVVSLSTRPSLRPEAVWVPIEPRAMLLLGASYTWSLAPALPKIYMELPPEPDLKTPPEQEPEPIHQLAVLKGQIVDDAQRPVPDVHVTLQGPDDSKQESITDAEGNYEFAEVPFGAIQLEARAVGFATRRWQMTVDEAVALETPQTPLIPAADVGMLRGLVRSFDSKPLAAHVTIADTKGKGVTDLDSGADGKLEIELPPGRYKVTIEATGYRKHTQTVRIKGNGVSVLNADMRAQ